MPAPILYEINTRAWLRDLSEKAGRDLTLSEIPDSEIERWKELGFTHIWLMGVWQVGPLAREVALGHWRAHWSKEIPSTPDDVHGSPFAIQEYAVDARLGEPLGLLMLKERLGRAGIKLILDFVPNHFGIDSPDMKRYPARFAQSDLPAPGTFERDTKMGPRHFAHGRDPYFPPWNDTVQIDHRVLESQQALTAIAQTISMYGEGLRCDMAMLLLPDIFAETWEEFPSRGAHQTALNFWAKAIPAIRQLQPHAELIAEVYWDREEELQGLGFDYTYNKRVYDYIVRGDGAGLNKFLNGCPQKFLNRGVHFIENHDEPRAASLLSVERHKAAAALILFLPGMALLHDGQLEGRRAFARIQMSERAKEAKDGELSGFYSDLLKRIQETHVRRGIPRMLGVPPGENGVAPIAIEWRAANGEADLAVVNLFDGPFEGTLPTDSGAQNGQILYGTGAPGTAELSVGSSGIRLRFPPYSAHIVRLNDGQKVRAV